EWLLDSTWKNHLCHRIPYEGLAALNRRHRSADPSRFVSPACGLRPSLLLGNAGENDRRAVREFSHERELTAHGLDGLAQRGQQEIAAFFEPRDTVLGYPESLRDANLREFARVPQFAQGHLLGDQLSGAGLDLLSLCGAQFLDNVVHVR